MATQVSFSVIFTPNSGIFNLTVVRADGTNVFYDPGTSTYKPSWAQIHQVGSHVYSLDLPPGAYDVYLSVVTNANCKFDVTGTGIAIAPTPTAITGTSDTIYSLTV